MPAVIGCSAGIAAGTAGWLEAAALSAGEPAQPTAAAPAPSAVVVRNWRRFKDTSNLRRESYLIRFWRFGSAM